MPPGYSRPVLMINAGVNAFDAVSSPTPSIIKGTQHLSQITGDINWSDSVTDGEVVVDIIPVFDFPDDVDGEVISRSNFVDDSLLAGQAVHFTYPGNAPYIRHRITEDVQGGSVTSYHNGYTNL